jgi:hypothetical protein
MIDIASASGVVETAELINAENSPETISIAKAIGTVETADNLGQRISLYKPSNIPLVLFFMTLFIIVILGTESYLQFNYPEKSLLALLHKFELFNSYSVVYQPNRGIWLDIGWAGAFLMLIMHVYSLRKKFNFMHEWGMLKHWLDFHIFCGIVGPILITFHSTFKLGGLVSISYWSLIFVALSGVFGRYIFGLVPRGIAGKELAIEEMELRYDYITYKVQTFYRNAQSLSSLVDKYVTIAMWSDEKIMKSIRNMLKHKYMNYIELRKLNRLLKKRIKLVKEDRIEFINILKQKLQLNRRIHFLQSAHRLFQFWHKIHIVLTVVIYFIVIIHIVVYYLFRVKV